MPVCSCGGYRPAFKTFRLDVLKMIAAVIDKPRDMSERVMTSLAVAEYVRAATEFEAASNRFNESCQKLRGILDKPCKFACKVSYETYIVTCDDQGNFNVESIEVL